MKIRNTGWHPKVLLSTPKCLSACDHQRLQSQQFPPSHAAAQAAVLVTLEGLQSSRISFEGITTVSGEKQYPLVVMHTEVLKTTFGCHSGL